MYSHADPHITLYEELLRFLFQKEITCSAVPPPGGERVDVTLSRDEGQKMNARNFYHRLTRQVPIPGGIH